MSLTVACVFVKGEYPYTPEYVHRLYAMVTRWCDRPFEFRCLTDRPNLFEPPIQSVYVTKLVGFAPWTKLELFNPLRQWTGRMLYLDLDSVIVAPLADIIDYPAPFAITDDPVFGHSPRTKDGFGRQIIRRFNSSVMVWDGEKRLPLYTAWHPDVSDRLSGDQDWIAELTPDAATMPRSWFPRLSELTKAVPPPAPAKVVLAKVPKNHLAVADYPWVAPLWGAA